MNRRRIFKGRALYVAKDCIWVARGLDFFGINPAGSQVTPTYRVGNPVERVLACFRLPRQLLRGGIHHLLPLATGGFLVALKGRTIVLDASGATVGVFRGYRGNKPAHRGVCATPMGDIFFGEYTINLKNTNPTSLYRSRDGGRTFQEILRFGSEEIRHIHFVQWDRFEQCLWMGTGDKDFECKLMRSQDNGDTWETVGQGSQLWRATGITVTRDALYWGTDAGSVPDPNYIVRWDRATREVGKLAEIQGPCHGNAVLADGTVYVATGVEGGVNEKDGLAHVWRVSPDGGITEVLSLKKDIYPYLLQYGVVRYPLGLEDSDHLVYTTYALEGNGEHVYFED